MEQMNFEQAIEAVHAGEHVYRMGWSSGASRWLVLLRGEVCLMTGRVNEIPSTYVPTDEDRQASDWTIAPT